MYLVTLAFVLVMLGGMGLSAVDGYDGLSFGMVAVGLVGAIGTAGVATQS